MAGIIKSGVFGRPYDVSLLAISRPVLSCVEPDPCGLQRRWGHFDEPGPASHHHNTASKPGRDRGPNRNVFRAGGRARHAELSMAKSNHSHLGRNFIQLHHPGHDLRGQRFAIHSDREQFSGKRNQQCRHAHGFTPESVSHHHDSANKPIRDRWPNRNVLRPGHRVRHFDISVAESDHSHIGRDRVHLHDPGHDFRGQRFTIYSGREQFSRKRNQQCRDAYCKRRRRLDHRCLDLPQRHRAHGTEPSRNRAKPRQRNLRAVWQDRVLYDGRRGRCAASLRLQCRGSGQRYPQSL